MEDTFQSVLAVLKFFVYILWILLPFLLFSIKDKIADLLYEAKKTNDRLDKIIKQQSNK